jgi:hypothetical protein
MPLRHKDAKQHKEKLSESLCLSVFVANIF